MKDIEYSAAIAQIDNEIGELTNQIVELETERASIAAARAEEATWVEVGTIIEADGKPAIIAQVGYGEFAVIGLDDGNRHRQPHQLEHYDIRHSPHRIRKSVVSEHLTAFSIVYPS